MAALKKAMTIAGSDTSGGAGMAADLKTFEELGVYGMTALTCIVAQDPFNEWYHNIFPIDLPIVKKQLVTILDGIGIDAMKTGMLGSAELVELVANTIDKYSLKNVVIDPVMVCKGIDDIMVPSAAEAIKELLVKRCSVITPNTIEAAYLSGMHKVKSIDEIKEAAGRIKELGAGAVVIKGGERMENDMAVDVFYDGKDFIELSVKKIYPSYNHGAGCTFSAAITAGLANGLSVIDSVRQAKAFITAAIKESFVLNKFSGCTNHPAYRKSLKNA